MANATKRGDGRWLGRYRGPDGKERTKMFPIKGEAKGWAEEQEAKMRGMTWTDPRRAKVTLKEWAPKWLATQSSLKPKTLQGYESLLKTVVLPRWGDTRLDQVSTSDVRSWVANMKGLRKKKLSASRTRQAYNILSGMLALAVEDGRLPKNPAKANGVHSRNAAQALQDSLSRLPDARPGGDVGQGSG